MKQAVYDYIKGKYKASPEFPWQKYPGYAVFRHEDNRKWSARHPAFLQYGAEEMRRLTEARCVQENAVMHCKGKGGVIYGQ